MWKCPECGSTVISRLIQAVEITEYDKNGRIISREITDIDYLETFSPKCGMCGANLEGGE